MSAIRLLWTQHRIVFVVFLVASAVTVFFLVRLVAFTLFWSDPAHRNLAPEPWMTPGYVAHSWGLTPKEVMDFLKIEPGDRPTLADIAKTRGVPVEALLEELTNHLSDRPTE